MNFIYRLAQPADVDELLVLENQCFESDRLNARSFLWMVTRANARLIVALTDQPEQRLAGYALVLFHHGTSLGRLYSLAISDDARGQGLGQQLLAQAEQHALDRECAYLRLEVRPDNAPAIRLYERNGYRLFDRIDDYYKDHAPALRYEKRIREHATGVARHVPYYPQTLDFSCGPACLLMAMKALQPPRAMQRHEELQIWREATTVFMTSGHGGCSPQRFALAPVRRGVAGGLLGAVRGALVLAGGGGGGKREGLGPGHGGVRREPAGRAGRPTGRAPLNLWQLQQDNGLALVLISSYRLTRSKAPHWVLVTGCDDDFVYLHDPDIDHSQQRQAMDCQYMPVSHKEFAGMSCFGGDKLRAAVVLYPQEDPQAQALI